MDPGNEDILAASRKLLNQAVSLGERQSDPDTIRTKRGLDCETLRVQKCRH